MSSPVTHEYLVLRQILEGITAMTASVDRLTREVSESREVSTSIMTLVSNLAAEMRANANDSVAIERLADDLDSQQREISAAVTENTPAAEQPPVEEPAPFPNGDGNVPVDENGNPL